MDHSEQLAPDKVDIVMFGMSEYHDWQHGIVNRNCHVLHTLLRHPRVRKVIVVDYLPYTKKRAVREWFQNIVHGVHGKVISRGPMHKLVAVREADIERTGYSLPGIERSAVPYKLFVYSDVGSARDEAGVYKRLSAELGRLGVRDLLLWSYLPVFVGYFGALGEQMSVFDAVDNWIEHASYKKIAPRLQLNYEAIKHKADVIFTTSEDLVKFFDRPRCWFMPNGISLTHVASAPKLVGRDVADLPRPIIGYGGTLQEDRIDIDLVARLAQLNPTKSFVLVGPVWPGIKKLVDKKLKSLPNVHLLGRKPYQEALSYYREFTVAIIPHLANEFNRHTNPLKLYDYLALGKPIVATKHTGLDQFKDVIHLAGTPEEFNTELLQALAETAPELAEQRKERAKAFSWDATVDAMLKKIFENWPAAS